MRRRLRGLKYKGNGVYENSEGDKYQRVGRRKVIQISDEQMGWTRKLKPRRNRRRYY